MVRRGTASTNSGDQGVTLEMHVVLEELRHCNKNLQTNIVYLQQPSFEGKRLTIAHYCY